MPKRTDIHKILIIGSGPIVIGQACEFDYSGTQACKALRGLGYQIVLVNSNPATIMTDPETADITYIEPLNVARLTEIIQRERPDALLPNLGGQSGLNLCAQLHQAGVLEQYGVRVIGVRMDAIQTGEDRIAFKERMDLLGIEMPLSKPAYSLEEARYIAGRMGYPVVIRPAYTMGGAGGGFVQNQEELEAVVSRGLSASLVGQVLVEESVLGWEELELEVVRDATGRMITVCFIENIDPMGVHTGDSFCAAPMLTVSQETQRRLEEQAHKIVDSIGVIGGTNVQFAHHPQTGRIAVIEINPRTSRSSALASKATGFPIALVSAMLAVGLTLEELPYWKGGTLADYTPGGDYVVIKFARWAFDKLKGSRDQLGTQMKAVGEVMAMGKTYKEAFQKAIRSLEIGRCGLGGANGYADESLEQLMARLEVPSSERQFILYEAIRKGADLEELHQKTGIKRWFLEQMRELVEREEELAACGGLERVPDGLLIQAKEDGFADRCLADVLHCGEGEVARRRMALGCVHSWEPVPVSGVEGAVYYYGTYHRAAVAPFPQPWAVPNKPRVMILGGGPNRIGQGIEFDYCCVHAALTLRGLGYETIMVNCNPETVSTDYDTSDKLYFEPLTVEDVWAIYQQEQPVGIIAQFGGQTPLNLSARLERLGARILGTSPHTIDLAEDREHFRAVMEKLGIPMPESEMASTPAQALAAARKIGYPVMVRPSYVLGGAGMRVVHSDGEMKEYMQTTRPTADARPILVDRFLQRAVEVEADAVCNGRRAFVPAVMEHIEQAGIHSGDSACVIPSAHIPSNHLDTIREYTGKIAVELGVIGLLNIQYAIADGEVYILEANPRASRTVPLVSKVCDIQMVRAATRIIMGEYEGRPWDMNRLKAGKTTRCGVKEAVFPFNMFPEVDPLLGPEMLSTGEVLGLGGSFGKAFLKAQEGAGNAIPCAGSVLVSVADADKREIVDVARSFACLGYRLLATGGTAALLRANGVEAQRVSKLCEGGNEISALMEAGLVSLVINTPSRLQNSHRDDSYIRKTAVQKKIPYVTTLAAAKALAQGLAERRVSGGSRVQPLQCSAACAEKAAQ